ncbi:MAG: hypothetical protein A7315_08965, partial [Candidatus Altiarchaeales archaeon WOR_SM1_79]
IVEVGKLWVEPDPDQIFKTLMKYNSDTDTLEIGDALENPEKSEIIQGVAEKRGTTPEEVFEGIKCRAKVYEYVTNTYTELKKKGTDLPDLLEVPTMTSVNNMFISAVNEEIKNTGTVNYDNVYEIWEKKFDKYVESLIKIKERLESGKIEMEEEEKPKEEVAEDLEIQILEIVDPEEERRLDEERRKREEEERRKREEEESRRMEEEKKRREEERKRKEEGSTAGVPTKRKEEGTTAGVPTKRKEEGSTAGVPTKRKEEGTTAGVPTKRKEEGTTAGVPTKRKEKDDSNEKEKKGFFGRFKK